MAAVDVWVDARTGLPLQVQVSGATGGRPALDTRFLDLALARPAAATTAFTPPYGAAVREGRESEVLLEAGDRIETAAAARRRWPACRAAGSRACPRGSGSTAAA